MKKLVFFVTFALFTTAIFAQELAITRVEDNTTQNWAVGMRDNGWPAGGSGRQWDAVLNKYKVVRLRNSDPFAASDPLEDRIIQLSVERLDDWMNIFGPHTVYLTMENRKFICLIYNWFGISAWVYEVK